MAQIICKDVSLSYEKRIVLRDLSFQVDEGDYLCIVGENGSGKSTLVKALLGLKNVAGGSISFGDGLRQNEIGYLPQQTQTQRDFPASVREVVLSGCLGARGLRPFYSREEKEKARKNMAELDILELKNRCYRDLSGGQQQRVLLARALCATRRFLLLDEPVTGLDPIVTQEMYAIIKKINDQGVTVVMVSHHPESAVKYASRILHLHNRPLFFGPTEDYVQSDAGRRFLGGSEHA